MNSDLDFLIQEITASSASSSLTSAPSSLPFSHFENTELKSWNTSAAQIQQQNENNEQKIESSQRQRQQFESDEQEKYAPLVSMIAPMILDSSSSTTTTTTLAKKVNGKNKKRASVADASSTAKLASVAAAAAAAVGDDGNDVSDADEGHLLLGSSSGKNINSTIIAVDSNDDALSSANAAFAVFSQAAIKASNRRRTVEEPISCISCGSKIGILELRGTPASFEAVYVASIRCGACCDESLEFATMSSRRNSVSTVGVIAAIAAANVFGTSSSGDGVLSPLAQPSVLNSTVLSSTTAAIMDMLVPSSTDAQQQQHQFNRKRRGAPHPSSLFDEILSCQVCKRATAQGSVRKRVGTTNGNSPTHRTQDSTPTTTAAPTTAVKPTTSTAVANNSSIPAASAATTTSAANATTWTSPDFSVSLICNSCHTKYLFCSECGGGGKSRTGKYRPRALFPANRRTCSLPHIRIGTTPVSHRVIEAPLSSNNKDDAMVLDGVRDVFFDCLVSLYAVPGVLEGVEDEGGVAAAATTVGGGGTATTLARIHADVEMLWTQTVRDAIVSETPRGLGGGKIYVTVAWIEKRNRNKGKFGSKKKKEDEEENVPWLVRLAMEGTVAPLKGGGSGVIVSVASTSAGASIVVGNGGDSTVVAPMSGIPVINDVLAMPPPLPLSIIAPLSVPFGEEKTYVAFAVSEWIIIDRARGALFVLQMAPRSVYLPTMESYGDLLRRNIERVQADSRRDNAPTLEHIWCWTRDVSHSRLRSIPERLGFVPLEQYMRENPGVDRQTFTREGYLPLQEEGVSVHVTSVRRFMDLVKRRQKPAKNA
ncbi:hypothetical protein HK100_011014 [Physocladia obscura]|uniref:Uncharacterized protein n=1 Tax=Physocladia obscura TaxID=109957 RepID=A0AAD5XHA9_9FUNG|nr:hypothetical protein HK100_011014 [Physocladia obscura]